MWRSSLWSLLETFASPAIQLALAPALIWLLGLEGYGHFALLIAASGLATLLAFGIPTALQRRMPEIVEAGAHDSMHPCRPAMTLTLLGGAASVGIGICVLPMTAGGHALASTFGLSTILFGALIGLSGGIGNVDQMLSATLRGGGWYRDAAAVEVVTRLLQGVLVVGAAAMSNSVLDAFLAWTAVRLAALVAKWSVAADRLPPAALRPIRRVQPCVELLRYAAWHWVQGLGTLAFTTFDKLIVGSALGATALGVYTVCVQVGHLTHVVATALFQPFLNWAVTMRSRIGLAEVRRRILANVGWNIAFVVVSGAVLSVLAEFLAKHFVGSSAPADTVAVAIATIWTSCLLAANVVPFYGLLAVGRVRSATMIAVMGGLLFLLSLPYTAAQYGLVGSALSRGLYGAIVSLSYALLAYELINAHRAVARAGYPIANKQQSSAIS